MEMKFNSFSAKLAWKKSCLLWKWFFQLQNIKNSTFRKEVSQPGISNGIIKTLIIGPKMLQETSDHLSETLTFDELPKKDQGQAIQYLWRKPKYKNQNHSCCHQWLSKHDCSRDCHRSGLQRHWEKKGWRPSAPDGVTQSLQQWYPLATLFN